MRKRICKTILVSLLSFTTLFSFNPVSANSISVIDNTNISRTSDSGAKKVIIEGIPNDIHGDVDLYSKDRINYSHNVNFEIKNGESLDKEIVFLIDTSGSLNEKEIKKTPFDFSLFSGSIDTGLLLQGQNINIVGDVHTNNSLLIKADSYNCTNSEYVTGKDSTAVNQMHTNFVKSDFIEMKPIYDDLINPKVNTYEIYRITPVPRTESNVEYTKEGDKTHYIPMWPGETKFVKIGDYTVKVIREADIPGQPAKFKTEETTFNIPDQTSVFVDGDLSITKNLHFRGKGLLCAKDNIDILGGYLDTTGAEAFIYSNNGNIRNLAEKIGTDPTTSFFNGIMCAPQGFIELKGANITVTGSVISKSLSSTPSTLNIEYKETDLKPLKEIISTNTYLTSAVKTAQKVIETYRIKADTHTKIGILKYDSNANTCEGMNSIKFYDMAKDLDYVQASATLKNIETYGNKPDNITNKSNLGDGLRRAYEIMLKSSNKYAAKIIMVFTGSKPNTYTTTTNTNDKFKLGAGDALYTKADSSKALNYVLNVINPKFNEENIVPVFINCIPTSGTDDINKCFKDDIAPKVNSDKVASSKLYYAPIKATPTSSGTPTPTPTSNSISLATPTAEPEAVAIDDSALDEIYSNTVDYIKPKFEYTPSSVVFDVYLSTPQLVEATIPAGWKDVTKATDSGKHYQLTIIKSKITTISTGTLSKTYSIASESTFLVKYKQDPKFPSLKDYNQEVTFPDSDYLMYTLKYTDPRDPTKVYSYSPDSSVLPKFYNTLIIDVKYKIDVS